MIELTDEEWDKLFDKADETIQQVISELPDPVKNKAESIDCKLDRYCPKENWKVLGMYFSWTSGPIFVYVGQIYEDSRKDMDEAMKSVRQVYLHELAHAIGNLEEYEVKERGL
jgi:hypothetical protein